MKLLKSVEELRQWRKQITGTVGFVPTMGALHEGHFTLVKRAKGECEQTIVSIFVNPTQFNNPTDLEKYPHTLTADLEGLQNLNVDAVFLPTKDELYPDNYKYEVREKELSKQLCGAHRAGHFEGVLTIVLKLFNLTAPTKAYFGEKDYQQLQLIQGMSAALFLDVEVVACSTVREADGLAMSSRNMRLSPEERELAPRIFKILNHAATAADARKELENAGFQVEYIEDQGQRRFAAAHLGNVRLIDNVEI